jgi:hypothetical protein
MTVTLDRKVEEFIGAPRQLFIDGSWADSASGKTFETPNPATGETLAPHRRGRRRGHQPRRGRGPPGLRDRPVEPDVPVRARPDHLAHR